MIVLLVIFIILIVAIYTGLKRGFILQNIYSIGYMFNFLVAHLLFRPLSKVIEMVIPYPTPASLYDNAYLFYGDHLRFVMHEPFYNSVSFLLILLVGWFIVRLLVGIIKPLVHIETNQSVNLMGGAIVSFLTHYIGIFLVLFTLTTIPFQFIQEQFQSSAVLRTITTKSPILTNYAYQEFVSPVEKEVLEDNE